MNQKKKKQNRWIARLLCGFMLITQTFNLSSAYAGSYAQELSDAAAEEIFAEESPSYEGDLTILPEGVIYHDKASASDALPVKTEEIRFEGMDDKILMPGETLDLFEGVSAKLEDRDFKLAVIGIESEDEIYTVEDNTLDFTQEDLNLDSENFAIKNGVISAESATLSDAREEEEGEDSEEKQKILTIKYAAYLSEDEVAEVRESLASPSDYHEPLILSEEEALFDALREEGKENTLSEMKLEDDTSLLIKPNSLPEEVMSSDTLTLAVTTRTVAFRSAGAFRRQRNASLFVEHYIPQSSTGVSGADIYTYLSGTGVIKYNGANLNAPLIDPYVEIKVPLEHLSDKLLPPVPNRMDGLQVPPSSGTIKSVEYRIDTEQDGRKFAVAKVNITNIDSTTSLHFPYLVRFKNNRTVPKDYELPITATIYANDGSLAAPSSEVRFRPKYDAQAISKYILSNREEIYKNDHYSVYGGVSTNGIVTEPSNVPFMFQLQTGLDRGHYTFGNGLMAQRIIEEIKLEDKLPLYRDERTGQTVPATFDEASNPGWTVSERDAQNRPTKVRYTVESVSDDTFNGGADKVLRNVVLKLQFPGLNVNAIQQNTQNATSRSIENAIEATLIPYGASPGELANPEIVSDKMLFRLDRNEVKGAGMISKRRNRYEIKLEDGYNHLSVFDYLISYRNTLLVPARNIVITDTDFDERTYIQSVSFWGRYGSHPPSNIKEIWAKDASGARTSLIYSKTVHGAMPSLGEDQWRHIEIDTQAKQEVEAAVAQVEAGAVLPQDASAATRRVHGIDIVFDEDIPVGDSFQCMVKLAFLDPYHVSAQPEQVSNSALVSGEYTNAAGQNKSFTTSKTSDRIKIVPLSESVSMSKITVNIPTGGVGEIVTYRITLDLNGLARGTRFRNPKFIDLLPAGVTYLNHAYMHINPHLNGRVSEVIPDYRGTGRTALVIEFDDFKIADLTTKLLQINIATKITEDAIPDPNGTMDSSINKVYFLADNFYPLKPGIQVNPQGGTGSPSSLVDDIYDADDNPATDKLLGASAAIKLNLAGYIKAYKEIRRAGGGWRRDFLVTDYGENFDYGMVVVNTGGTDIDRLMLYDILPRIGDQPYINGGARNSQFNNKLRAPIQTPPGFSVYYSLAANPITDSRIAVNDPSMAWSSSFPADPSAVTAIKIVMEAGTVVRNNTNVRFVIPMEAAPYEGNTLEGKKATNDYAVSYDGGANFGVTNSVYNTFNKMIKVKKDWQGGNARPPVKIRLKQNQQNYTSAKYPEGIITLDQASAWEGMFTDLPLKDAGNTPYLYTVEEVDVGIGDLAEYAAFISGDADTGFTVTNRVKEMKLRIVKEWDDASDVRGLRPNRILFHLKRSIPGMSQEVVRRDIEMRGNGDEWVLELEGIEKYDSQGREYSYEVEEVNEAALSNYTVSYSKDADGSLRMKNSFLPKELWVRKNWEDDSNALNTRPAAIEIQLYRESANRPKEAAGGRIELREAAGVWEYRYADLAAKDGQGADFTYSVEEIPSPGIANYIASYTIEADGSLKITNRLIPNEIKIKKNWVGDQTQINLRPSQIEVQLKRSSAAEAEENVGAPVRIEPGAGGAWEYSFGNLLKFDPAGNLYVYRAEELADNRLLNYRASYAPFAGNVLEITNTFQGKDIPIEVRWVDHSDAKRIRPADVNIKLQRKTAGGSFADIASALQSGTSDTWSYRFSNMPEFDENGNPYIYQIVQEDEGGLNNYPNPVYTEENGIFAVTNTLRLRSRTITKTWDDQSDANALRPASIEVELKRSAGGVAQSAGGIRRIGPADGWTASYDELEDFDAKGVPYVYTAEEKPSNALKNYQSEVMPQADGNIRINNRLITRSLSVHKEWADNQDALSLRPAGVEVQLKRRSALNGEENVGTPITLTNANLSHTYHGLPKYDIEGNEFTYFVQELPNINLSNYRADYTSNPDGSLKITNTLTPNDIVVRNIWIDDADALGLRPQSIEFQLKRSFGTGAAEDVGSPIILNQGNGWTHSFLNMPRYSAQGEEYQYFVEQQGSPGLRNYRVEYSVDPDHSLVMTNSMIKKEIAVIKEWEDHGNIAGVRPQSIGIELKRSLPGDSESTAAIRENWSGGMNESVWKHTFSGLPIYDAWGNPYTYRVEEIQNQNLRNYTVRYEENPDGSFKIINTMRFISVSGEKIWRGESPNAVRPSSIRIHLYRSDSLTLPYRYLDLDQSSADAADPNKWNYRFEQLPEFDAGGNPYIYTVNEAEIPSAYSAEVEGYRIINTYLRQEGSLLVQKKVTNKVIPESDIFEFTLVFDSPEEFSYTGSYRGKIKSGDKIHLRHGEYILIEGIPLGTSYRVEEKLRADYYAGEIRRSGRIMTGESFVEYENVYREPAEGRGRRYRDSGVTGLKGTGRTAEGNTGPAAALDPPPSKRQELRSDSPDRSAPFDPGIPPVQNQDPGSHGIEKGDENDPSLPKGDLGSAASQIRGSQAENAKRSAAAVPGTSDPNEYRIWLLLLLSSLAGAGFFCFGIWQRGKKEKRAEKR
ncbi:MAG: Cna B-type domain-containing protein [Johnsonella sp.]|nr:Cna B-type domain-containing protein [Johnsonella sp.]